MKKTREDYWKAIDLLFPRHRISSCADDTGCTDDSPNGHGNFGCKRCQMIVDLEKERRIKIWPRSKVVG